MASYVDYTSKLIASAPPYVRQEDIIDAGCTGSVVSELTDAAKNVENAVHSLEDAENSSGSASLSVNGVNPFKNHIINVVSPLALNAVAIDKFAQGVTNAPAAMNKWDTDNFHKADEWIKNYQEKYDEEIKENARILADKINELKNEDGTQKYSYSSSTSIDTLISVASSNGISCPTKPKTVDEVIKEMPNYNDCIAGNYGITYLIFTGPVEGLESSGGGAQEDANGDGFVNFYNSNNYWSYMKEDFAENYRDSGILVGTYRTINDALQVGGNTILDIENNALEWFEDIFPSAQNAPASKQVNPGDFTNPYNSEYWGSLGDNFTENFDYSKCQNVLDVANQLRKGVTQSIVDGAGVVVHGVVDTAQAVIEGSEALLNWLYSW